MQIIAFDDDFLPRAQDLHRHRQHRRASSCCGVPISPHLRVYGLSRRRFSYDKLPHQPLKLTIRKLDGSSFDVEVAKTATVAELKGAVEGTFSHIPRTGSGKISWPHVWGHFCLCYDGWKLLAESEPISNYGINDGDQLQFVRHVSINFNLVRRQSKDRLSALEQPRISDGHLEIEKKGGKNESYDDQENSCNQNEDVTTRYNLKLAELLGRWFTYHRLGSSGRRSEQSSFSSRLANGLLGSFKSIVRLCSSNKLNSRRDPLEEV
ncbi:hypothetical protein U1Q18_018634 [Sarracenia purpurea var. burkii]